MPAPESKRERVQRLLAEDEVRKFNASVPVGSPVLYWRGAKQGPGHESRTTSGAVVLSGHTAVVWLHHVAGCIALSHVEPLK